MSKREPTPAEKGRKTKADKAERAAKRARIHAENAPIRKAWKDVRVMIRGLGAYVRPSRMPSSKVAR